VYLAHWQLERPPFGQACEQADYYPSQAHQSALLKLRYGLEHRGGAALLCGPSGTGKTLLVRLLGDQLPSEIRPRVHLVFPQLAPTELMGYLADELHRGPLEASHSGEPSSEALQGPGDAKQAAPLKEVTSKVATRPFAPSPGKPHTMRAALQRIEVALARARDDQRRVLVIIDEAHLIQQVEPWETLRLLLNLGDADGRDLCLLLVGQPGLLSRIQRMPAWEERLAVKCLLRPLAMEETMSYVQRRLVAAGASGEPFTTGALETLHELSGGVPRRINRLADLCLLLGYAEELAQLGPAHVEAAAEDLALTAP
jgi:general secretion pathway protein A